MRVRCAHWDTYLRLYTTNISRGGMLLRVPEQPDVGTLVNVTLSLPDGQDLPLSGRVARVAAPKEGETLAYVGVSLNLSQDQQVQLDRYLLLARSAAEPEPEEVEIDVDDDADEGQRETVRPVAGGVGRELQTYTGKSPAASSSGPIVGIDFGTSTSSVGIVRGDVLTLFDDEGVTEIPSVVWFRGPGDAVVGMSAREQMAADPTRAVHSIKRLLGVQIDDPHAAPFLMSLACPGRAGPNRSIVFEIDGEQFTPVQIAACILRHLKAVAERHVGGPVERAVMAFPLAFGEHQRADMEKAAKIAGLELVAMLPEPAAAAMAYGRKGRDRHEVVGIYDFGGGTFDFCVLDITGNLLKVLGAAGDPWLGGDDLDQALAKAVADEFWRATKIDVRKRTVEWQRVIQACEEAKRYLSMATEIDVYVPNVALTPQGPLDLSVPVTRDRFEELTAGLIDSTLTVCEQALREARLRFDDLSDVLLIGGTSRLPAVAKAVRMIFRRDPHDAVHPERAVVIGAAIKAAELEGRPVHKGTWPGLSMQQVAGRTVGLAMAGGVTEPVIARSAPLPTLVRRVFATHRDNQPEIVLLVVEGESSRTAENRTVGQFRISNLTPAAAGAIEVEVIFAMDESGTLSITARDLSTGARTTGRFELDQ